MKILILLIVVVCLSGNGYCREAHVGLRADHRGYLSDVSAAMIGLSIGDSISLDAGKWYGCGSNKIVLKAGVTVKGAFLESGDTAFTTPTLPVFDVKISRITITNAGEHAIVIANAKNARIEFVELYGNSRSIIDISSSDASIEDCYIHTNNLGVYAVNSILRVTRCKFDDQIGPNKSSFGLSVLTSRLFVTNSNFSNCFMGLYAQQATTVISNSFFENDKNNGAVHVYQGSVVIESSTFTNNEANTGGAAMFDHADAIVRDSLFLNNTGYQGAAIYSILGNLSLVHVKCHNNSAHISGGCLTLFASHAVIEGSLLTYNNATEQGGGVFMTSSDLKLIGGTIIGYNSLYGAACTDANNVITKESSSTIVNNKPDQVKMCVVKP